MLRLEDFFRQIFWTCPTSDVSPSFFTFGAGHTPYQHSNGSIDSDCVPKMISHSELLATKEIRCPRRHTLTHTKPPYETKKKQVIRGVAVTRVPGRQKGTRSQIQSQQRENERGLCVMWCKETKREKERKKGLTGQKKKKSEKAIAKKEKGGSIDFHLSIVINWKETPSPQLARINEDDDAIWIERSWPRFFPPFSSCSWLWPIKRDAEKFPKIPKKFRGNGGWKPTFAQYFLSFFSKTFWPNIFDPIWIENYFHEFFSTKHSNSNVSASSFTGTHKESELITDPISWSCGKKKKGKKDWAQD